MGKVTGTKLLLLSSAVNGDGVFGEEKGLLVVLEGRGGIVGEEATDDEK
jgi:hypothetical protein